MTAVAEDEIVEAMARAILAVHTDPELDPDMPLCDYSPAYSSRDPVWTLYRDEARAQYRAYFAMQATIMGNERYQASIDQAEKYRRAEGSAIQNELDYDPGF